MPPDEAEFVAQILHEDARAGLIVRFVKAAFVYSIDDRGDLPASGCEEWVENVRQNGMDCLLATIPSA